MNIYDIMLYIAIMSIFIMVIVILTIPFRNHLPKQYVCDIMAWHADVDIVRVIGTNNIQGKCKKCGRKVARDSQGNWF